MIFKNLGGVPTASLNYTITIVKRYTIKMKNHFTRPVVHGKFMKKKKPLKSHYRFDGCNFINDLINNKSVNT